MRFKLPIGMAALATFAPPPASACTFSYAPGTSPEEVMARRDVRRVRGTFRINMAATDRNHDGFLDGGVVYGFLSTPGRAWITWHYFSVILADCGARLGPTWNATGTFWIARRPNKRGYQLLLWEGRFLEPLPPAPPPGPASAD